VTSADGFRDDGHRAVQQLVGLSRPLQVSVQRDQLILRPRQHQHHLQAPFRDSLLDVVLEKLLQDRLADPGNLPLVFHHDESLPDHVRPHEELVALVGQHIERVLADQRHGQLDLGGPGFADGIVDVGKSRAVEDGDGDFVQLADQFEARLVEGEDVVDGQRLAGFEVVDEAAEPLVVVAHGARELDYLLVTVEGEFVCSMISMCCFRGGGELRLLRMDVISSISKRVEVMMKKSNENVSFP
jgi:hypothetical protein